MAADIAKLKKIYPDLIQVKIIGKSEFGRNIYAVGLGKGKATAFINGSHHAREWLTTNFNMYMIDRYAAAYKNGSSVKGYNVRTVLNSSTLWFVPMVNPDGVTLQQSGLKAFPASYHAGLIKMNNGSKNFKRWKSNAKGVDLNRQYDAKWAGTDSPKSPSYRDYKGTAPHTASEVKAVLSLVNSIDADMALSYHTTGKILFWNYEQSGSRLTRDKNLGKKLSSMTGYRMYTPSIFKNAAGFSEWFSRMKQRTAFTIEISPYYNETNPPVSEFKGAWSENQAAGLFAGAESAKMYGVRMDAKAATLKTKLTSVRNSAKKLQSYYYTNVKTRADLRKDKAFMQLYAKTKSDLAAIQKSLKPLPVKNQNALAPLVKEINLYITRSTSFITAIDHGDKAVSQGKLLESKLQAGTIDAALHKQLASAVMKAQKAQPVLYGNHVKQLFDQKYLKPVAAISAASKYALDRLALLTEAEKQITAGNQAAAQEKLEAYDKLQQQSSRYKQYPAIEKILAEKRLGTVPHFPEPQSL
ncbi:peptidase M14 [Peribacillus deserti]|uniref:Peptidase M14 n=2 Tax=Peribacillus deserti TaxID=673318 RepID=A0A2N5MBV3_9BACI|nr:peptidase M14 [Peribacillus deserti]